MSLEREIERAVERANADYLANPDAQAEAKRTGERWGAWMAARREAGPHAAVVPVATMRDVIATLRGEPSEVYPPDLLARMLEDALSRARGSRVTALVERGPALVLPEHVTSWPDNAILVAPYTLWSQDDGGRAAAGYRGDTGDCACRAIAIASGLAYQEVYDLLITYGKQERKSKGKSGRSHPRTGVHAPTMNRLITRELGGTWTPTMTIGSGTKVHLRADELPAGRLVTRLSRHYAAVIDGIVYDTYDPTRDGSRAVYGFWTFLE